MPNHRTAPHQFRCERRGRTAIIHRLLLGEALDTQPEGAQVISPLTTKPIRTVLKWQLVATVAIAVIAGIWAGEQGMISAVLGGLVNVVAGAVYAFLLGLGQRARAVPDVGSALSAMLRAEAAKILVIVGGLWIVLSAYKDVVPAAFFTAFAITVIVFSMAFFVRE
jgi:ATP synthase protein I